MQEETIIYVFLSIFFLSVCFFSDRLGYFILISLLPAAEGQTRRLLVIIIIIINLFATNQNIHNNHRVYIMAGRQKN